MILFRSLMACFGGVVGLTFVVACRDGVQATAWAADEPIAVPLNKLPHLSPPAHGQKATTGEKGGT
jgi:hypothetical protein